MAAVHKVLVRPAVYTTPQGVLHAYPSRVKGWADTWRRMSEAGIKVPVSYGHQPRALPLDPTASREQSAYHFSALNAGYVADMSFDPATGNLSSKLDCPGMELDGDKLVAWTKLPDGREVKTAIGEVSVAIKKWTDGQGREWPDAIVHVALTPLPVAHGTGGFEHALSCVGDPMGYTLSLNSALYELATESDMEDEYDDDLDDSPSDLENDGAETLPEAEPEPEMEPEPEPEPAGPLGGGEHFTAGLEFMAKKGIRLPPDTTPENFWERLAVISHALGHENHDEGSLLDDDDDLDDLNDDDEDDDTNPRPSRDDAMEEQRPILMSLATAETDRERILLGREQERHRKRQLARIDKLVKRGLTTAKADKLRERVASYELSMSDEGAVAEQDLDFMLSSLEEMIPETHPLTRMKTASEVGQPAPKQETAAESHARQVQAGVELAEMVGFVSKQS